MIETISGKGQINGTFNNLGWNASLLPVEPLEAKHKNQRIQKLKIGFEFCRIYFHP